MKRSPIERKTPLKPGKPPTRKKRVKASNPERKARMRTDPETGIRHTYGAYHQWIKRNPCEVATNGNDNPCYSPRYQVDRGLVDGHHMKKVKTGGKDYGNELPLCRRHHMMIEHEGPTRFRRKTDVDPNQAAARWRKEWDRTRTPPRTSRDPGQP